MSTLWMPRLDWIIGGIISKNKEVARVERLNSKNSEDSKPSRFSRFQKYDTEYFESGKWKCPKSPTGSHVWTLNSSGSSQCCRHCSETREVDTTRKVYFGKAIEVGSKRS